MSGTIPHGLGRIAAPDERDKQYRMAALLPAVPVRRARYYATGPVLDQGQTPECVGYAWRGWLSAAPVVNHGGPSADGIYHAAQQNDETPGENYEGTSVRGGVKALQLAGFVSGYVWAWDADTVAAWLLAGKGPVVFGTDWYESMFTPDSGGLVVPRGSVAGGHAYLCIGYSATTRLFRCVNSWGTAWGQKGRFWLRHDDVDMLLRQQGEACTASELLVKGTNP